MVQNLEKPDPVCAKCPHLTLLECYVNCLYTEKNVLDFTLVSESCNQKSEKSPIRKPRKYRIHTGRTDRWWLSYETNSVTPNDWTKNF